jgi:hypothetical protein
MSRRALAKIQELDFGGAILRFRRQALMGRLWNKYALNGENYRRAWEEEFAECFERVAGFQGGEGVDSERRRVGTRAEAHVHFACLLHE